MSMNIQARLSRSLTVAGIAGALLFTSACAAGDDPKTGSDATFTASAANSDYGPTINGVPTLKEPASDENGTWRKTTILPDDPAFDYDASVVDAVTATMWSEDEVKEAQRLSVEMAVDMIDTAGNGAPNDLEARVQWWEANQDKFDPAWAQDIYNALISDDPNLAVVFKGSHRLHDDSKLDYGLVYGDKEAHIKDREIQTASISAGSLSDGRNAIMVTLELEYKNIAEVDGKHVDEEANSKIVFHLAKNERTGKLLVTGLEPEYRFQILR